MSQKLTSEQTKALLDSLFALPDRAPKAKKEAKPKAVVAPLTPIHKNPTVFKPVAAIVEVVWQNCTTCGSQHSHIRSRRIRFEGAKEAHEFSTVVPSLESLPRRIDQVWEDTSVCPTCAFMSMHVEDIIALRDEGVQLELFHG